MGAYPKTVENPQQYEKLNMASSASASSLEQAATLDNPKGGETPLGRMERPETANELLKDENTDEAATLRRPMERRWIPVAGYGGYMAAPQRPMTPMHGAVLFPAEQHSWPRRIGTQPQVSNVTLNQEQLNIIVNKVVDSLQNLGLDRNVRNRTSHQAENNINNNVTSNSAGRQAESANFLECIGHLVEGEVNKHLPVFDNKNGVHPMEFIECIESSIDTQNKPFSTYKGIIANKLEGSALLWKQAFMQFCSSYQEFKKSFIEQFWSESKQLEVRLKLQSALYNENEGFANHFLKYLAMAKYLQPAYAEPMLIGIIARHYPPSIAAILVGTENFNEAMEKLRQADYYYRAKAEHFISKENTTGNNNIRGSRDRPFFKPRVAMIDVEEDSVVESGNATGSHC